MKYECLDLNLMQHFSEYYLNVMKSGYEKYCLIGNEAKYRINVRDSILTKLTDPEVLIRYCLYPLFINGDKEISTRVESYLKELVESEDIICIYQVVKFIYTQDQFINGYEDLPLIINITEILPMLLEKIEKMSDDMRVFREGEFALYPTSIYGMIQNMIKKSTSFQLHQ